MAATSKLLLHAAPTRLQHAAKLKYPLHGMLAADAIVVAFRVISFEGIWVLKIHTPISGRGLPLVPFLPHHAADVWQLWSQFAGTH